ncbi:MAG: hypothetical protein ACREMN_09420, partial [Gemmatimonadales bacterium]
VAARTTFVGAELGLAYRPDGQGRIALSLAGGETAGRAAARVQLSAQFVVTPVLRRGAGLYGGLGVAVAARRRARSRGYIAVLLGVESAPGGRGGWYVELGLAGGVRVAVGWRVRWWRAG